MGDFVWIFCFEKNDIQRTRLVAQVGDSISGDDFFCLGAEA